MSKILFNRVRRSTLEVVISLLKSLNRDGGKIFTHIMSEQTLSTTKTEHYLDILLKRDLIKTEERPTAPSGLRRKCTYYLTTPRGQRVLRAWNDIEWEIKHPSKHFREQLT